MSTHKELADVLGAKIKVIGVGGGGGNAVNTMIRAGLEGVEFYTANTDVQALKFSLAPHKLQIGKELTKGLGAGADPDVGRDAALEDRHEIQDSIGDADMVFITAGMGGGTGTGAAAITAQIARECGALTVAVVTKPFNFEGKRRRKHAEMGIARLRECVDTLITIPNQRLLQIATPDLSMVDAFKMADNVLVNAVKGISDIINIPGTVNVDFADVKTVMSSMGHALMGIGYATGEGRAAAAARQAICSPLLEDVDIEGATGILINITAGSTVALLEINEACSIIQEAAHEDANIIFGAVIDESMGDGIRVTVIATGFPMQESDDAEVIIKPASAFPISAPSPKPNLAAPKPQARPEVTRTEVKQETFVPSNFNSAPATTHTVRTETVVRREMHAAPVAQPAAPAQNPAPQHHVAPKQNVVIPPQAYAQPAQVMMPPPVQPLMMSSRPPVANGVFTQEVMDEVLSHHKEEVIHDDGSTFVYEETHREIHQREGMNPPVAAPEPAPWTIEEAFGDIIPEEFQVQTESEVGSKVYPETRIEGAVAAPRSMMHDDFSELNLMAGSIEQKIDEALDLAETLGSNMQMGVANDQDDLDIPAFLRMGTSSITDVKS